VIGLTEKEAELHLPRAMLDHALFALLIHTGDRFGLWPERLVADTGYGSAAVLDLLVHKQGIEPRIPVFEKSTRKDGTFSRSDFTYDHQGDFYTSTSAPQARSCGTTGVTSSSPGLASTPKVSAAIQAVTSHAKGSSAAVLHVGARICHSS
jgi:hypothetical protein